MDGFGLFLASELYSFPQRILLPMATSVARRTGYKIEYVDLRRIKNHKIKERCCHHKLEYSSGPLNNFGQSILFLSLVVKPKHVMASLVPILIKGQEGYSED